MSDLVRFGVAFDEDLLAQLDAYVEKTGYANRSELLRDLARNALMQEQWEADTDAEVMAALTIVFDHHTRDLEDKLTSVQHDYHGNIVSTLHVHIDQHDCMEVLVLRGKSPEVKELSNHIMGMKGVKHGKLTLGAVGTTAPHRH